MKFLRVSLIVSNIFVFCLHVLFLVGAFLALAYAPSRLGTIGGGMITSFILSATNLVVLLCLFNRLKAGAIKTIFTVVNAINAIGYVIVFFGALTIYNKYAARLLMGSYALLVKAALALPLFLAILSVFNFLVMAGFIKIHKQDGEGQSLPEGAEGKKTLFKTTTIKKLLAVLGILSLLGTIVLVGVAKSGEYGVTTVPLSEGRISFDWLVEPKMNRIFSAGEGLFSIQEKSRGSWDVINASGDVLLDDFYQVSGMRTNSLASSDVFIIEDDRGKNGLATMSGDILVKPQYFRMDVTKAADIWEISIRERFGGPIKYNFIDRNGNKMFKEDFSGFVDLVNKDRFIHKSGDKYGIIDSQLNVIVKYEYPSIEAISIDRVVIAKDTGATKREDHLYGLYDSDGAMILPMEYERIAPESEGLIAVKKNGKIGFVDRDGNLKIDFISARKSYAHPRFVDGMAVIMTHRFPLLSRIQFFDKYATQMIKSTVIDTTGKKIFSTGGFLSDYSQGVFLIYRGKEREFVLVTRSGDLYPLPKDMFPEGPDAYLSVRLNYGVISTRKTEIENDARFDFQREVDLVGLLKFTIKEK